MTKDYKTIRLNGKIKKNSFFRINTYWAGLFKIWVNNIGKCAVYDFDHIQLKKFKNKNFTEEEPNLRKLKNKNNLYFLNNDQDIKNFDNIFFTYDTPLSKKMQNQIYQ